MNNNGYKGLVKTFLWRVNKMIKDRKEKKKKKKQKEEEEIAELTELSYDLRGQ